VNDISKNTFSSLQIDSGLLFYDIQPEGIDTAGEFRKKLKAYLEDGENYLGITDGGIDFRAVPEVSVYKRDGEMFHSETGCFIVGWDVKLSVTLMEFSPEIFKHVLPNAIIDGQEANVESVGIGGGGCRSRTPNIVWVGEMSSGGLLVIELKNAVNVDGINFVTKRNTENGFKVGFKAFADENSAKPPFTIYWFGGE